MSKKLIPDYPFTIRHLTKEDGGGFLIEYPDLPGCMSDGVSIEEAVRNGKDAVKCWIAAAKKGKRSIPALGDFEGQSGKWVQRVPKSFHRKLVEQAEEEGVSLNTLVIALLAEGLGKRESFSHSHKKH